MAVTLDDIARKVGVCRATVIRALQDRGRMRPETRERIKAVAAELKYRPNQIARSLAKGSSNVVGVIAECGPMVYFPLDNIDRILRQNGFSMQYCASVGPQAKSDDDRQCIEHLAERNVAGIIAIPNLVDPDPAPYQELLDRGIKLVVMDKVVRELMVPQIVCDHYNAGVTSANYLISLGHRRITYLAIPDSSWVGHERRRGFLDAMNYAGLPIHDTSIITVSDSNIESGYATTKALLHSSSPPTAIIARHDLVAIGAIRAIFELGLSVPEDISVVGYANIPVADCIRPPLTSVPHAIVEMTTLATQILLRLIASEPVEPAITAVAADLVIRSSCAPPRHMSI